MSSFDTFSLYYYANQTSLLESAHYRRFLHTLCVGPSAYYSGQRNCLYSQLMTELKQTTGNKNDHTTLKRAQTIALVQRTYQKLKQIHKINVTADTPQWDRYVNIAVMAQFTTYRQFIKSTPTKIFNGHVAYNALDLKLNNPIETCFPKPTWNYWSTKHWS